MSLMKKKLNKDEKGRKERGISVTVTVSLYVQNRNILPVH